MIMAAMYSWRTYLILALLGELFALLVGVIMARIRKNKRCIPIGFAVGTVGTTVGLAAAIFLYVFTAGLALFAPILFGGLFSRLACQFLVPPPDSADASSYQRPAD